MKKILTPLPVGALLLLLACQSQETAPQPVETSIAEVKTTVDTALTTVDIKMGNTRFDKSLNDAASLISVDSSGQVTFRVGAKKDFFSDPDGKLSNNSAPILLSSVDNTKPFTLTARVTPQFTPNGMYNAGVLYIYSSNDLYQKFCFEQDESRDHRVVSVRTVGTSDDNNHDLVQQKYVFMKISSDTKTVGSYYSLDNKKWKLARLYKNEYPSNIFLGISAQCPVDTGTVSYFNDVNIELKSVKDFRLGI
jgi:regulation of enolase protein 1 (concanavalin A-like superfamily)